MWAVADDDVVIETWSLNTRLQSGMCIIVFWKIFLEPIMAWMVRAIIKRDITGNTSRAFLPLCYMYVQGEFFKMYRGSAFATHGSNKDILLMKSPFLNYKYQVLTLINFNQLNFLLIK